MHMADALLSPAVAVTMYAASAAAAGVSLVQLRREELAAPETAKKKLPTMAVMSALVFAGQMINYTIPGTGSSGHLCGGIKAFESTAKKYGIDFALKKDSTETPPRYFVFFKGRDADALTAAFKEFSAKKLTQEQNPSIRKLIVSLKEKAAALNAQRDKVKNKDRGIAR